MFLENKYKKWYFSLIENCKDRKIDPEEYYECHHIIPQGIGGTNDVDNLVMLTGREHFICHRLILKFLIDPIHKQYMGFALTNFLRKNKNTSGRPIINSRTHDQILKEYRNSFNKECQIIDPNNNIYEVKNLKLFCQQHGLSYNYFRQKIFKKDDRRIIIKKNRGWRCLFRNCSTYRK